MKFLQLSKKLTYEELKEVENQLGVSFTPNFRDHYVKYNGGYPVNRNYLWPDGVKTRINHFFSIRYKGFTQLEEAYMDLFVIEQILPVGFLPFASDDGGDFFCISTLPDKYNAIFFCDMHHYDAEIFENYFTQLSISFNDFIENLID
ncbi:SMI1/KNR4 family protein [Mucilaginibacter gotjawali]|uniref:SMI1 / KNR4 family protein n=2 Tax=Mucilaginibacter gotjawali TaxID=1550579 RepID=A0A110B031_9SPHI|nr:SMI1/KNR4 family protein [Mucilaginibacter gotjawali]MBB3058860.1 cell wall assembly regulator SMI1 [Mucilaginibacter gotjawali]BAU52171.1 SMI1 / KNR4 family protein [Mucilaginibacter gotjawali]